MQKKNKDLRRKKNKALRRRMIAVFTVTAILAAAVIGGAWVILQKNGSASDPVIEALQKDTVSESTPPASEAVPESDRVIHTAGPGINDPQQVVQSSGTDRVPGSQIVETEPEGKVVYITFDDGPCATTPQLLDVLDQCNVKVTFFVTAQFMNDEALVEQMREIHQRGHKVAVHSYTHEYGQIYSSVSAFMEDYERMDALIYEATGEHSKIFRFPGGSNTGYNSTIRTELIQEVNNRGLIYHDWNAYDGDCDGYTGQDLINRAVTECSYTDRAVLLMHNIPGKETVIESMPEIVRQLREAGYSFDMMSDDMKPIQFI